MTGDALRTQLAEVLGTVVQHSAWATGVSMLDSDRYEFRERLTEAVLPFLARARAEVAAEALRDAAQQLPRWALTLPNGADPQEVADWLDARADRRAALSAHTTEGDPT